MEDMKARIGLGRRHKSYHVMFEIQLTAWADPSHHLPLLDRSMVEVPIRKYKFKIAPHQVNASRRVVASDDGSAESVNQKAVVWKVFETVKNLNRLNRFRGKNYTICKWFGCCNSYELFHAWWNGFQFNFKDIFIFYTFDVLKWG